MITESVNWKRAVVENASLDLFKSLFWNKLSKQKKANGVIQKRDHTSYEGYFYTLAELSAYCKGCFGFSFIKSKEEIGSDISVLFVCPYGTIHKTFSATSHPALTVVFAQHGWTPAYIDTTVQTGNLKSSYKGLNAQMCFLLDELSIIVAGDRQIFYKVAIPDERQGIVQLMRGVKFPGIVGIIPQDCVIQRNSRLPYLLYKAYPKSLNSIVFGFRPFQVINNRLQWMTRPLSATLDFDSEPDNASFVPDHFSVFTGNMTQDFLDSGDLVGLHVMFKLYEDEWTLLLVKSFIDASVRTTENFMYEAKIVKSRGVIPILFRLELYNASADANAVLGTWFIVNKS